MNPIELALRTIVAAQAQKDKGTMDVYVPKDQIVKIVLPENKFEQFEVHPVMKDFWKTKINT
jgi:predicted ATP-dependent protease